MPSTVIRSYQYDAATGRLSIVFQSGRRYVYKNVPDEIYSAMKAAFSKGEFFNHFIRGQYSFVRSDSEAHVAEPHVGSTD